ncbi:nuclear pore complex protein NUP50A-like isoform X2 [Mangifera indica]|uniref:nuclear pore complex protein NUP50A-like isoform X2 n=1 Tax=Mangifera indica TaxID=29780 RepID=UPI001CFB5567|nr:nuclear pore complex protein NUP50A-like isoform X2 [Mangifera indica]
MSRRQQLDLFRFEYLRSTMGDAENLPPSKKRAAGRELCRDNPGLDDEEDAEPEGRTFKRASDEVLANRRIVKVRRSTTSTPSSNPFAAIKLIPPADPSVTVTADTTGVPTSSEKKVSDGEESGADNETEKGNGESSKPSESKVDKPVASAANEAKDESNKQSESKIDEPLAEESVANEAEKGKDESTEQSASKIDEQSPEAAADKESTDAKQEGATVSEAYKSKVDNEKAASAEKTETEDKKDSSHVNKDSGSLSSFGQLSSSQNAFMGFAGTGFSTSTFSFGSISKDGSALSSGSSAVFGQLNNGNSSLFNTSGASIVSKSEGSGFPSMQEVVVETGEENETVVFSADSVLFEFLDGAWKERGKGEIKVNVSSTVAGRARLLMRTRGNFRLILNASLYPDMKLTNMDKKGIIFACINNAGEGKDSLSTFALKFKDVSIVEEFRAAVTTHKGKTQTVDLKTPENSPKASDD